MVSKKSISALFITLTVLISGDIFAQNKPFNWPSNKSMGISFTWDDGRESQVINGTNLLDQFNVKATFYVLPSAVEKQLPLWQKAVASGHEIANHSLSHPCSGNFLWSRKNALEEYSLAKMEKEILEANRKLNKLLGVKITEYAYPCGQTFVGKGLNTKSYVPIIAKNFRSGRTWMNEAANDPSYCDLSQITGVELDGKEFEEIIKIIETAKTNKLWLVFAGHEMGEGGPQTTKLGALEKVFEYLNQKGADIWVAPVGEISKYIKAQRVIN